MKHITTYSGIDFYPTNPNINDICIEDIAHALSMMCRANGHFVSFFSIAQHCLNCAYEAQARGLSKSVQLACLLHDASEAYLSDITRPVKAYLPEYLHIEHRLQQLIYQRFLPEPLSEQEAAQLKQIDDDMLVCEFRALMRKPVFAHAPQMQRVPDFSVQPFAAVEAAYLTCLTDCLV